MNESTIKYIVDTDGKARWYRVVARDYVDALCSGGFSFKMIPLHGKARLAAILRSVWCMSFHKSNHVTGDDGCGVRELRCLKCGLEFSVYPKL
jgi:hypothetical protein